MDSFRIHALNIFDDNPSENRLQYFFSVATLVPVGGGVLA